MMLNTDMLRAIGMMVARQAREKAEEETTAANEVIDMAALLAPWKAGTMDAPVEYAKGCVRTHNGAPWRCAIAHTHHGEEGWEPGTAVAMWFQAHGTDAAHAMPYAAPTCAEDVYNAGEWMIWTDGKAYRCTVDATTYGPDVLPDNWETDEAA